MSDPEAQEISCDLCILGAGIAGLNALFVASQYLSRNNRIVVVDRRADVGGMWLSTYQYVRLHQPHPLFTAGNIPWTFGKERSHLATGAEVLSHLRHCFDTLRGRVTVEERFGYEYKSHEETGGEAGDVIVLCASPEGKPLRIRAKKLVKALGHDVKTKKPLSLSSERVRSASPDQGDLLGKVTSAPSVYIVGGGKTAMDTAYTIVTRFPEKPVSLLVGRGTLFVRRDDVFPAGARRLWGGSTPAAAFLDLGRRFDGSNEGEVLDYFRSRYAVSLVPDARRWMFALMSDHENAAIASGVREVIRDYFTDVIDRDGRPTLFLRSGASRPIEPGSLIVNCTGYLFLDSIPYEPFVSPSGKVVSIHSASALHFNTAWAAYFATHLSYLDLLHRLPLYESDPVSLYRVSPEIVALALGSQILHNTGLILRAAPRRVFGDCGVDFERWYPPPRQLLDAISFLWFLKHNPDHFRRALDVIRDRFGVRCGPLRHVVDPWTEPMRSSSEAVSGERKQEPRAP
jgi:cation diffusion facilitator CzcD-associated flavoprotein CzcO